MTPNPKHSLPERARNARAAAHRPDDGEAFLPDHIDRPNSLVQTDGEPFAEEFIQSALTGEPVEMDAQDEVVEEEWGGPFVELSGEEVEGEALESVPEPPSFSALRPAHPKLQ